MEKGQIEFSIAFQQPGWNSVQNGNVKLFCYINSNCVFSKTIWKNDFDNISGPGGNSEQKANV